MGILALVDGDTFATQEEHNLFVALMEHGEVIASKGNNGGWGHHDAKAVVKMDGQFYLVEGGGCSCYGSASVKGPFETRSDAGEDDLPAGDNVGDY